MVQRSWVGRRVSVRRVITGGSDAPAGRPRRTADVVGELVSADDTTIVVIGRQGQVVIDRADVVASRLVPTSTAGELALQFAAGKALRPRHAALLDGWLLRANGDSASGRGRPRRANSVLAAGQLARPLDDAVVRAREWYGVHDLPLVIQVPTLARRALDDALAARGWTAEGAVRTMAIGVPRLVGDAADARVEVHDQPDGAWLAFDGGERDLLVRHETVGFSGVREADSGPVVAAARGCVDDGWLGISGVRVDPTHRRQGLAAALIASLARWAGARGATHAYVQVERDNEAAFALYERLGFWPHHDYHYRRDPGAT